MSRRRLVALLAVLGLAVFAAGLWRYGVIGAPVPAAGDRVVLPGMSQGMPVVLPGDAGPDAPLHVLLLGTSLTHRGQWPEALETRLAACARRPVHVERLARPGAASDWGLAALETRLAEAPAPQILVVEFSINDASPWHGMALSASRARHAAILALARARGIAVFLATMNPAFGRETLERPGHARYAGIYRSFAAAGEAGLIDTLADWQALDPATRARFVPDGLHPTAAGMAAIAVPAFAEALAPMVCAG